MDYLVITRTLLASHEDDHTCTGIKLMTCISVNMLVVIVHSKLFHVELHRS